MHDHQTKVISAQLEQETLFQQITFEVPVSSSNVRKTVPFAVEGICLTITNPATDAKELFSREHNSAQVKIASLSKSLFIEQK